MVKASMIKVRSARSDGDKTEVRPFSQFPEREQNAKDLSKKLLPSIYHKMCTDSDVSGETSENKIRRIYHCDNMRRVFADVIAGTPPREWDVTYHINGLSELIKFPILDTADNIKVCLHNLTTYAREGKSSLHNLTQYATGGEVQRVSSVESSRSPLFGYSLFGYRSEP